MTLSGLVQIKRSPPNYLPTSHLNLNFVLLYVYVLVNHLCFFSIIQLTTTRFYYDRKTKIRNIITNIALTSIQHTYSTKFNILMADNDDDTVILINNILFRRIYKLLFHYYTKYLARNTITTIPAILVYNLKKHTHTCTCTYYKQFFRLAILIRNRAPFET